MVPQTNFRRPPLRQQDIDDPHHPAPKRGASWKEALEWLDGQPGGIWTVIGILALFCAATWGLLFLWQIAQTVRG